MKRYDPICFCEMGGQYGGSVEECTDGEYVKHEYVEKLRELVKEYLSHSSIDGHKDRARLREELKNLIS